MGIQDAGWGWGAAFLDIWNRGGPQQPEIIVANGLTIPETTYDDTFWNLNPTKLFSARHTNGSSSVWRDVSDQAGINSTEEGRGVVIFDWNQDGKTNWWEYLIPISIILGIEIIAEIIANYIV